MDAVQWIHQALYAGNAEARQNKQGTYKKESPQQHWANVEKPKP